MQISHLVLTHALYFLPLGVSAGANLAAAVTLKLRDMHITPQPKLQVLIYPITQTVDSMLPSYISNEHDPDLFKKLVVSMWLSYAKGNISLDT